MQTCSHAPVRVPRVCTCVRQRGGKGPPGMGGELRLCVFIGVGKEHFLLLSSSSPPEGGVGVATAGGVL